MPINIEIKARCADPEGVRRILQEQHADFKGLDHQIDTYFRATHGRLKLREGTIEHSLIHYQRSDQEGPKKSAVILYHPQPGPELKSILTTALGVLAIVDKKRSIYFIENVKFHVDEVSGLGSFVEIEAIDTDGSKSEESLLQQCQVYMALLGIDEGGLIAHSYSDLLLRLQKNEL